MNPAAQVARDVRRARGRSRRERQSLGDALYAVYVTVLVSLYPLAALGSRAAPRPGPLRSAVAAAEPLLLLAFGVAVVAGRAAAAVRGGPVVLPPEDARLLLTWPVPRRSLVLPALGAALSRALAGALLVSVVLVYVDVRDLGAPARAVLRDDLLLPALLGCLAALTGWLVQGSAALARVARVVGAGTALTGLVAGCWLARQVALDGTAAALRQVAVLGPSPGTLPLSGAATGAPGGPGPVVAAVLAVTLVPLGLLSLAAARRATPEQLLSRSRRADVTRTGLRLGFTSSVYLTRSEPVRRSRRRRRSLPPRPGPGAALADKAFVQEQGTPVLPRLLVCAAVTGLDLLGAARVTPGRSLASTAVWAAVAAAGMTVVATRFADPIRLDVDRAPLTAALPVRHLVLARADLGVSAGLALAGALLGCVAVVVAGIVPAGRLPGLLGGAVGLALLLAAAGALGALSDDPSPFLPPWLAIGYRTSGLVAVTATCELAALLLRHAGPGTGSTHPERLPSAALLVLVGALATAALAAARATAALTRGR